ncbi:Fatty acid hydroxylase superfamily protein [Pseudodesulfovibrio profundus]|uniref:Fatty acid hydroxylase superfamily protein n=1 Tax=Pseudodesulfovibrio profundus TaxID=57320 RepID=A0A2C8F3U0_9BACT|nr:sterol desaturase family protein [Pseudodesulfovibrio profundus]SOB57064.1 Fatty acid hydroxylase superfamily protein [Pseudodesulfovibrio profundus]
MAYEPYIRLGAFFIILIAMGVAETLWPRRVLDAPKAKRWFSNVGISFVSAGLVRLLLPLVPTVLALYCTEQGWGLLNILEVPYWFAFILSVLILDMLIYGQHVAFHYYPILWRLHRMHHADINIDASTGIRFHPIEIFLSMVIKLVSILVLGPPASAVLTFEVLLNGSAMFNHANVFIPIRTDATLRQFLVTPDMHRVHHSTHRREYNTNYGFCFPWWDRMFKTYTAQPAEGHTGMKIGLNIFRDSRYHGLFSMLRIPFL